jgi:hypothetical protein
VEADFEAQKEKTRLKEMNLLREYIRSVLKEEAESLDIEAEMEDEVVDSDEESAGEPEAEALEIETVGDLKDAIAAATGKKRVKVGAKAAKNFAKSVFIDIFPGMGTITGAGEALKAMYSMPDDKRTGTALDYLDVDDDVSAIVDDPIENAFLKNLEDKLESYDDDRKLKDLNMTKLLSKHIRARFNKRTVSGFEE